MLLKLSSTFKLRNFDIGMKMIAIAPASFDIYLSVRINYIQNWCGLLLLYPYYGQCEKPENRIRQIQFPHLFYLLIFPEGAGKIYNNIMGLFNFFDSNSQKKREIQNAVFKLSAGLSQIEEEMKSNNNQITPFAKAILSSLSVESRNLYNLLSPNGRTDWNLANQMVKLSDGKEITVHLFCSNLYHKGIYLYEQTGINIAFSL